MEEISIRARHPESNVRIERYRRSVREEVFGDTEVEDLYYLGNPQALLAERKTKLREAAAGRREVNGGKNLTRTEGDCSILVSTICPETIEPVQNF